MRPQPTYEISAAAAAALIPPGGTILVELDSRRRMAESRLQAALELAVRAGAGLVVFDTASASLFTDPYPSGPWTADVDGPRGDRPLTAEELRPLGRDALRGLIQQANGRGVASRAWLARGTRRRALTDAAARIRPDLVVAAPAAPSLVERALGEALADRSGERLHLALSPAGTFNVPVLSCPLPASSVWSRPARPPARGATLCGAAGRVP